MRSPAPVVRNEVRETQFGLYSDAEVKALSACRLTSSVTYDGLGNALPGGLYDSRLGPRNQGELCVTCGLSGRDCPGHVGHIEFEVPVYHPLLFLHKFQVLRASCAFCHGLRMSKARCRAFAIKLKLYEMNDVDAAQRLDDEIIPPAVFDDLHHSMDEGCPRRWDYTTPLMDTSLRSSLNPVPCDSKAGKSIRLSSPTTIPLSKSKTSGLMSS